MYSCLRSDPSLMSDRTGKPGKNNMSKADSSRIQSTQVCTSANSSSQQTTRSYTEKLFDVRGGNGDGVDIGGLRWPRPRLVKRSAATPSLRARSPLPIVVPGLVLLVVLVEVLLVLEPPLGTRRLARRRSRASGVATSRVL